MVGLALSTASAADRDPIEGKWLGEAGTPDNHAIVGLEVRRDEKGALGAFFTNDLVHFFGAPVGTVETRGDGRYAVPGAEMEITLAGDALHATGFLDDPKGTVELHRTQRLPSRPAARRAPKGPGPRWQVRLGGAIFAPAALRDGTVYVGNLDGVFVALALADGDPVWKFAAGRPILGEALVTDDAVYFGCDNGFLFKLDRATGKELWRYDLGDGQVSRVLPNPLIYDYDRSSPRPELAGDVLYLGSGDGSIHAVHAADGSRVWRVEAGGKVRTSAALHGPHAIFATTGGAVRMVDRASGATVWQYEAGDAVTGTPVVTGDRVIVGSRASKLVALELATGKPTWSQFWWGSWVESAPVVADGHAYIGSGDLFRVSSFDPITGKNEWRTDVGGWVLGSPAVTGTRVFAGVSGARRRASFWVPQTSALTALDRTTGRVLWSWPMPEWSGAFLQGFVVSPAVADGTVVIGGVDGTLYAFPAE